MTGGGVSDSDMPSQPWTARQDVFPVEDTSLAALLAGNGLPAGAGADLRPVADVLAALTARPASDELTGLAAARAEFRRHIVLPVQVRQSPRRRPGGLASRLGTKVGAVAAVVAMGLGGAAAAAYADALPGQWQQFAHRTIGAPASMKTAPDLARRLRGRERPAHDTPAGTGAAAPAADRPCAAYQHALAHGTVSQQAAALRNLVKAAPPAGKVTSWCAAPPYSRQPAQTHSSGPSAGHGFPYHAGPPHNAGPPAPRPSAHRGGTPAPVPRTTTSIGAGGTELIAGP